MVGSGRSLGTLAETGNHTCTFMRVLKRSNRIYDTSRFGQPEIRLRHRAGSGVKSSCYVLRCGCCGENLQIFYSDDGLEIGGVNGALEDWREILLPLLRIEQKGGRFIDNSRRRRKSATKRSTEQP